MLGANACTALPASLLSAVCPKLTINGDKKWQPQNKNQLGSADEWTSVTTWPMLQSRAALVWDPIWKCSGIWRATATAPELNKNGGAAKYVGIAHMRTAPLLQWGATHTLALALLQPRSADVFGCKLDTLMTPQGTRYRRGGPIGGRGSRGWRRRGRARRRRVTRNPRTVLYVTVRDVSCSSKTSFECAFAPFSFKHRVRLNSSTLRLTPIFCASPNPRWGMVGY